MVARLLVVSCVLLLHSTIVFNICAFLLCFLVSTQALFDDYTVPPSDLGAYGDPDDPVNVKGIKLALHVAITSGRLELMHVGGVFDR